MRLPVRILLAALLVVAGPAVAQPATVAGELAGLFVQGCLAFAGDPAALRDWATRVPLPILPEPARGLFLNGATGLVFDASNAAGKLVLVSSDDGLCAVATNAATDAAVRAALEGALQRAGLRHELVIDRNDRAAPGLHYREYVASRDGRHWRILAATMAGEDPGQAMLTAGPGAAAPAR